MHWLFSKCFFSNLSSLYLIDTISHQPQVKLGLFEELIWGLEHFQQTYTHTDTRGNIHTSCMDGYTFFFCVWVSGSKESRFIPLNRKSLPKIWSSKSFLLYFFNLKDIYHQKQSFFKQQSLKGQVSNKYMGGLVMYVLTHIHTYTHTCMKWSRQLWVW
jgi:hypothetical protein